MNWLLDWFKTPRQKAAECFRSGCQALDDNDFDLAVSWFNAAIAHDASHASGYYGRGFAHLKKASYDSAIADLSEAIRLGPDNPYSYYYRSLCYGGKGRATLEGVDFEKALKLGAQIDETSDDGTRVSGPQADAPEELVMALRAAIREASLHDLDERVRALAGKAISQLDAQSPADVPALLEALRHDEPAIRFGAAHGLGDLGRAAGAAFGPLAQALQDRDLGVRVQAARALWLVGGEAQPTLPVLIEALRADDEVIRWIAADCLGDIGPPAAVAAPALEEALNGNFKISHVRTGIAVALERIKTRASADSRL